MAVGGEGGNFVIAHLLDSSIRDLGATDERVSLAARIQVLLRMSSRVQGQLPSGPLQSLVDQSPRIDGHAVHLHKGEAICTKNSYKYDYTEFAALAEIGLLSPISALRPQSGDGDDAHFRVAARISVSARRNHGKGGGLAVVSFRQPLG